MKVDSQVVRTIGWFELVFGDNLGRGATRPRKWMAAGSWLAAVVCFGLGLAFDPTGFFAGSLVLLVPLSLLAWLTTVFHHWGRGRGRALSIASVRFAAVWGTIAFVAGIAVLASTPIDSLVWTAAFWTAAAVLEIAGFVVLETDRRRQVGVIGVGTGVALVIGSLIFTSTTATSSAPFGIPIGGFLAYASWRRCLRGRST
jgi:hypothetical protein